MFKGAVPCSVLSSGTDYYRDYRAIDRRPKSCPIWLRRWARASGTSNATEGVTEDLKDALKEDDKPKPDDGLKDSLLSKTGGEEENKAPGNETGSPTSFLLFQARHNRRDGNQRRS